MTAGPEDVVQGARKGGGGSELTAICCSSHCDSGYFEALFVYVWEGGGGKGGGVLLSLFSCESTERLLCCQLEPLNMFGERQPSVHAVSLARSITGLITASGWTRRHSFLRCLTFSVGFVAVLQILTPYRKGTLPLIRHVSFNRGHGRGLAEHFKTH